MPCGITSIHHGAPGFQKQMRQGVQKQNIDYSKQHHTPQLVAHQGDVSHKLDQAFLLVDSYNSIFWVEEHSNI